MPLRAQLNDAMKEAMKAKDAKRLATVRLMLAALKDRDIAARSETSRDLLGDDEILTLLAKMIKQREESATAFDAGNRPELAAGEREEIVIIRSFMPAQMDEAAMKAAVQKTIADVRAPKPVPSKKVPSANIKPPLEKGARENTFSAVAAGDASVMGGLEFARK